MLYQADATMMAIARNGKHATIIVIIVKPKPVSATKNRIVQIGRHATLIQGNAYPRQANVTLTQNVWNGSIVPKTIAYHNLTDVTKAVTATLMNNAML